MSGLNRLNPLRSRRLLGWALTASALATLSIVSTQTASPARAADAPAKSAAAGDWPQWRGPDRDGKSPDTGLLKQWPAGGPPLAWKAHGIGESMGSVAVAGGRIYLTGDIGDTAYLLALNEKDGTPVWKSKIGKGGKVGSSGNSYSGPRDTPTVDTDHVYVESQYGDVVCFQSSDGNEVWRKSLTADFGGKMMSGWGFSESPLVDGDKLVVTPGGPGGTLLALNKKSGDVVWRSKDWTDPAAYSSPIAAEIGGVRQYIQLTGNEGRGAKGTIGHVAGVAADSGKVLWKADRKGNTAVIPTPIYHDGYVYVTSGYGAGCNLFQVTESGGQFAVKEVYANKTMTNHHGGVVLVDGKIYGYSDLGGWTCQDFKTGEADWQEQRKLGKGTVTYADGHLYLRQENGPGTVALIEASPKGYSESGHFDPPDRTKEHAWAHLSIANGKLYVRDQDTLLCYDVQAK